MQHAVGYAKARLYYGRLLAHLAQAVKWCANVTAYATSNGGKTWRYVLIPHDVIADNMTLTGLAAPYGVAD